MLQSLFLGPRTKSALKRLPLPMAPPPLQPDGLFACFFSTAIRAPTARECGEVKWFDAAKGMGFIMRTDGTDVFVHFSAIVGDEHQMLYAGQRVEFCVGPGPKGIVARVRLSSTSPAFLSCSYSSNLILYPRLLPTILTPQYWFSIPFSFLRYILSLHRRYGP